MILDCYHCERNESCDIFNKRLADAKDETDVYIANFTKPKNCYMDGVGSVEEE